MTCQSMASAMKLWAPNVIHEYHDIGKCCSFHYKYSKFILHRSQVLKIMFLSQIPSYKFKDREYDLLTNEPQPSKYVPLMRFMSVKVTNSVAVLIINTRV